MISRVASLATIIAGLSTVMLIGTVIQYTDLEAGFFLFITVVYNYSFARLIFVSGLDRRLPAAMGHVNANKVPDNAVWAQTGVAVVFTLLAFVVLPTIGFGGGSPVDVQTKIYDVLQAAVTVIWCISMVILFVDVVIIIYIDCAERGLV